MKHRWGPKLRHANGDSQRHCQREGCQLIRLSCHDRGHHWVEWWRGKPGGEMKHIQTDGAVPPCEGEPT